MRLGVVALLAFVGSIFVTLRSDVPAGRNAAGPPQPTGPPQPAVGIRVANGRLVEADGSDLVLRGINHGYTWNREQTAPAFAGIKAAGANAVRVSLAIGAQWPANTEADVSDVIALCKQNRLICVLDVHDTVGLGAKGGAATLSQAVDYWTTVRGALAGQENYVIVNVGDEPFALYHGTTWTVDTIAAVRRLRAAGFLHTLMVDAPDWGQDNTFAMRDNARTVLAADPSGNVVFSVHMYGVFDAAAKVRAYYASFASRHLPLVVGEFSAMHEYGNPDEDAIMAGAQAYRFGYLGWSWSGNSDGVRYLDMVNNFDPRSRTPWGTRFIGGPNGLSTTSQQAAVYRNVNGRTPDGSSPPTPVSGR